MAPPRHGTRTILGAALALGTGFLASLLLPSPRDPHNGGAPGPDRTPESRREPPAGVPTDAPTRDPGITSVHGAAVERAPSPWVLPGQARLCAPVTSVPPSVEEQARRQIAVAPWTVRERYVRLDAEALAPGVPVALNLFEDADLVAVFEPGRKATGVSRNTVWRGRIRGHPGADVTLVVGDGVAAGRAMVPAADGSGMRLYEVRYVADGVHAIREVDGSRIPLGDPVVPEYERERQEQARTDWAGMTPE